MSDSLGKTNASPRVRPHASSLPRGALRAIAGNGSVRKLAVSTPFIREVAWRFVAGEDLKAGISVIRELNAKGIKGTLSHVGTHVRTESEAIAAAEEAIAALSGLRAAALDSHLSVKLTQIGLDVSPALCRVLLRRVLDCARDMGTFVRIDMEESEYVEATIGLFEEMREAYGAERVGLVLQSYLRHRRDDLTRLAAARSRIRLVKGGYWEPADLVYRVKRDVDRAFFQDIELLLRDGCHPAIATHDPAAIGRARSFAASTGLANEAFEFQMLYGVRSDLQDRLVRDGYVVRCYVPYGGQWYEYVLGCLRRVPGGILQQARERVARHTRTRH
jgi:proline dehydrogenase